MLEAVADAVSTADGRVAVAVPVATGWLVPVAVPSTGAAVLPSQPAMRASSHQKARPFCRQFRQFSEESGIKRAVLGPINEWGEGSYVEPCSEFGFQMYEAIRNNLCEKPAAGWPLNYGPKDVGLGPYDYTAGARY